MEDARHALPQEHESRLTQTAVEITRAGEPEVLELRHHPVPVPGHGEILISVEAAGVNRHDCNQRRRGPSTNHSDIPGLEVAGRVAATGAGVRGWSIGDPVAALTDGGGYAEFAIAKADCALPVPEGLTFVEAAALPEALFTVWHNFFNVAALGPGETVLIHGGTSGVGTIAIQLLSALGHPVLASCGSEEKIAAARELGASAAFDYRSDDLAASVLDATGGHGVDVVLDMSGGQHTAASLRALARGGRIVHLSPGGSADFVAPLRDIMAKEARVTGSLLRPLPEREKAAIADRLRKVSWPLVAAGRVRPVIHAVLPLAAATEAHALMEAGRHIGKIVLVPGDARAPAGRLLADARSAWIEAVGARDLEALDGLLADDLVYVHSTGRVDDRASYRDNVKSGPEYVGHEFSGPPARIRADTALWTGDLRLTLRRTPGETPVTLDVLATQVWTRVAGRWRLSLAQTTRRV
jgi:NADPH:quinone reductase